MKKWFTLASGVLLLASLVLVPVGCGGPGEPEKITDTQEEQHPPEHANFKEVPPE